MKELTKTKEYKTYLELEIRDSYLQTMKNAKTVHIFIIQFR